MGCDRDHCFQLCLVSMTSEMLCHPFDNILFTVAQNLGRLLLAETTLAVCIKVVGGLY